MLVGRRVRFVDLQSSRARRYFPKQRSPSHGGVRFVSSMACHVAPGSFRRLLLVRTSGRRLLIGGRLLVNRAQGPVQLTYRVANGTIPRGEPRFLSWSRVKDRGAPGSFRHLRHGDFTATTWGRFGHYLGLRRNSRKNIATERVFDPKIWRDRTTQDHARIPSYPVGERLGPGRRQHGATETALRRRFGIAPEWGGSA